MMEKKTTAKNTKATSKVNTKAMENKAATAKAEVEKKESIKKMLDDLKSKGYNLLEVNASGNMRGHVILDGQLAVGFVTLAGEDAPVISWFNNDKEPKKIKSFAERYYDKNADKFPGLKDNEEARGVFFNLLNSHAEELEVCSKTKRGKILVDNFNEVCYSMSLDGVRQDTLDAFIRRVASQRTLDCICEELRKEKAEAEKKKAEARKKKVVKPSFAERHCRPDMPLLDTDAGVRKRYFKLANLRGDFLEEKGSAIDVGCYCLTCYIAAFPSVPKWLYDAFVDELENSNILEYLKIAIEVYKYLLETAVSRLEGEEEDACCGDDDHCCEGGCCKKDGCCSSCCDCEDDGIVEESGLLVHIIDLI